MTEAAISGRSAPGHADDVRTAGFRLLLETHAPVALSELSAVAGLAYADTALLLDKATNRAAARLDSDGKLVAIAGLSVAPDRHEITVWGRRFWTWCAYDALGILGALGATGHLETVDPSSGTAITVRFAGGTPEMTSSVLFIPARATHASNAEWCPNANLFATGHAAKSWARSRQIEGRVLPLADATRFATGDWQRLAPADGPPWASGTGRA